MNFWQIWVSDEFLTDLDFWQILAVLTDLAPDQPDKPDKPDKPDRCSFPDVHLENDPEMTRYI